ncbi:MAG TPA: hypothetical protein VJ963_07890, partial [Bacteroidales bacterium]|nr:hypothetical protein [Bacteroidales bacterium]
VGSCSLAAEAAAWAKSRGKSIYDLLTDIYLKHGFYRERLINIIRKGKEGADEIRNMMSEYRNNPPSQINNSRVIMIKDYDKLLSYDLAGGTTATFDFNRSNVLQFFLEDGSKISVRPSGTEPKIKYYFSVNTKLESADKLEETEKMLEERIDGIIRDMKLG